MKAVLAVALLLAGCGVTPNEAMVCLKLCGEAGGLKRTDGTLGGVRCVCGGGIAAIDAHFVDALVKAKKGVDEGE